MRCRKYTNRCEWAASSTNFLHPMNDNALDKNFPAPQSGSLSSIQNMLLPVFWKNKNLFSWVQLVLFWEMTERINDWMSINKMIIVSSTYQWTYATPSIVSKMQCPKRKISKMQLKLLEHKCCFLQFEVKGDEVVLQYHPFVLWKLKFSIHQHF